MSCCPVHSVSWIGLIVWTLLIAVQPSIVRGAEPADRQATQAARELLGRMALRDQAKDGRFWIGQNFGHSGVDTRVDFQRNVGRLADATGRWPAILAVDYGWNRVGAGIPMANRLLIEHSKKGGLVTISVHLPNPWHPSDANDVSVGDWDDLFRPGTDVHRRWYATLDGIADGLEELQQADVPVLWRPFHEMNGNWFWWSACTLEESARPRAFERLWGDTFRYLTEEKHLHHLLWVYSPNVAAGPKILPVNRLFPGQHQVDVVGCDYYGDPADASLRSALQQLELLNKPRGLCEFGFGHRVESAQDNLRLVESIDKEKLDLAYIVYWHSWPESRMAIVDHENAKTMMELDRVLTRGEIVPAGSSERP